MKHTPDIDVIVTLDVQQWAQIVEPVDRANTARLREILAERGWPGHQLVGVEAAHAAWLLAQHAFDVGAAAVAS